MLPNGRGGLYRGRIIIAGDRIREVAADTDRDGTPEPDLDLGTHVALPGFIDLQINGAFGHDITVDPSAMWRIGAQLPCHGVTAFAPTIITSPAARRRAAYEAARARPAGYSGAAPLGLHLEGPALAAAHAGAHPRADLIDDAGSLADELTGAAEVVAIVTLAPELEGATSLIRRLAQADIAVSLGHSGATAAVASAGFEAGATAVTHLFNGMAPLHHREVGIAGAGLLHPSAWLSLIADGHHLSDEALALVWNLAGPGRICLVTDAMAGMGAPTGVYPLGSLQVRCDRTARDLDGGLAGSLLSMPAAARRVRRATGATWDELALVTSANPAALLGDPARGKLAAGRRADIAVVDAELDPVATIVGGAVTYRRREQAGAARRARSVIGVDIGGSSFKAAVFDGARLGPIQRRATGSERPASEVLAAVRGVIDDLAGSSVTDVVGVGIACPGVVDRATGTVVEAKNLGWRNVDVVAAVGRDLALPLAIEHDVYLGALAEWETGAGVGADSMLYVSVGTGVAARLFTPSGTYRGRLDLAGEMGFVPVGAGGAPLESVASAKAMSEAYRSLTGRERTVEEIIATRGCDAAAAAVWSTGIEALATGIAGAICLQDPEVVVMGGGVSAAGGVLLDALRLRLAAMPAKLRDLPPIVPAAHGANSGIVGAALHGGLRRPAATRRDTHSGLLPGGPSPDSDRSVDTARPEESP
jgi:N-acetylglucosamine-6-phosphate deacetylase